MTTTNKDNSIVQLKENIYQFGAPQGSGGCKIYLIKGNKRNLLIDSGLPSDFENLERQLSALGLSKNDIDMIVLTHEHIDHIGGLPYFSGSSVVAAHTLAANKIGLQDEFVLMNKAFGLTADEFHIDLHLHHGTLIDLGGCVLHTLHTPGHCSGALCLYEPERQLLFTGDTIFANGTLGGIFPSGSISDYIATLQQLKTMKVKELYPGHGRISLDPSGDFEKAIKGSITLMNDTKSLFNSLHARSEFAQLMKSTSAYSKRV